STRASTAVRSRSSRLYADEPISPRFDAAAGKGDTRSRDSRRLRALGRTDDHRPDERRRLREAPVLDVGDRETVLLDRVQRRAVAVAPAGEPLLEAVQPVLPARDLRVVRAHVLEEQQPAARLEHTVSLLEGAVGVVDGAENERGDDEVEARVLERKL